MNSFYLPILSLCFAICSGIFFYTNESPSLVDKEIKQKSEVGAFCATDEIHAQLVAQDSSYQRLQEQFDDQIAQYLKAKSQNKLLANYTLPVVVHIIHNGGAEKISYAQVIQGIDDLNEAFENVGYYDPSTGVDTEIAFCLAKQDPMGNATTGITRDVSTLTNMTSPTDDLALKNVNLSLIHI